jgi:hypothetical protein
MSPCPAIRLLLTLAAVLRTAFLFGFPLEHSSS